MVWQKPTSWAWPERSNAFALFLALPVAFSSKSGFLDPFWAKSWRIPAMPKRSLPVKAHHRKVAFLTKVCFQVWHHDELFCNSSSAQSNISTGVQTSLQALNFSSNGQKSHHREGRFLTGPFFWHLLLGMSSQKRPFDESWLNEYIDESWLNEFKTCWRMVCERTKTRLKDDLPLLRNSRLGG